MFFVLETTIQKQSKESIRLTEYGIWLNSRPERIEFLVVVKSEEGDLQGKRGIPAKTHWVKLGVCARRPFNPDKQVFPGNQFPSSSSGAYFHFPDSVASPY